ncbi:hypothetical protein MBANPS3_012438 [Mucor bainieri]
MVCPIRRLVRQPQQPKSQGEVESASHYILCKTALCHKANANGTCAKAQKERTRYLRKGLLPHLQRKCFEWEFSPYTAKDHQELNTIEKLQTLLEWLESTEEITLMMWKYRPLVSELHERFSPRLPSVGEEKPSKKNNPKPGSANASIVEVNAVNEKTSDEVMLVTRLRNLEKARAMKALYKVQHEEEAAPAAAAAEAPEIIKAPQVSSAPTASKAGPNLHIRITPLDVEQTLDNIMASVPPQATPAMRARSP